MPFDHIIVVMMENHSFDNLFGDLGRTRSDVDALSFDATGHATNANPGIHGSVTSYPQPDTAQTKKVTQSWAASHHQINGGAMDGFVHSVPGAHEPMAYYTPEVLPFAYSLAEQFTIGDRWFCSLPGPTYPNRRFLMAGTAYGATTTATDTLLDAPPPHGTIFDQLSAHHINWTNYFSDVPMTSVIPSIILKHLEHLATLDTFFHDCASGTLPAVSFVDPRIGLLSDVGAPLKQLPLAILEPLKILGADLESSGSGETQEDPQSMYWGEAWAAKLVQAVLDSPKWERTLLIYIYDEHGGYYDHVPPPPAIAPDSVSPRLAATDPPGGYDLYGPRVPAVVVSPYARAGAVTSVIHDHTSVLATIEAKWNLPALTDRDANAETVMDFLDLSIAPRSQITVSAPPQTGPPGPVATP
jgi:phospholipase C